MRRHTSAPVLLRDLTGSSPDEIRNDDGKVNRVFITPSGARIFRALISGVLMDKIRIETEDAPNYRLRIADPTGGITFSVGRYDPELIPVIEGMSCPSFVVIIGKVRSYINRSGEEVVTIKPESITECTKEERDQWMLLAVRDLLSRRWIMQGRGPLPGSHMRPMDPDEPRGGEELEAVIEDMVRKTLVAVDRPFYSRAMDAAKGRALNGPDEEETGTDIDEELEDNVLQMIQSLDKGDGARWDDIVDVIEEKRMSRDIIEEVVSNLLDRGLLYEPILGYLKPI